MPHTETPFPNGERYRDVVTRVNEVIARLKREWHDTSTVIVGHSSNLQEAAGVWPKKEGGASVFRPDGHGAFTLVGSLDPADLMKAAE